MKNICSFFVVLMTLAIPLSTAADDFLRGDCNEDGNVNISDVTCLINYLLSHHWPGEDPTEPETVTYVLNGIEINMVHVEGGTFTMGASGTDTEAYDNEFPAHIVTLSDYYICTTEVTQQLYRAVMGSNPSSFTGDVLCPVEDVTWPMCQNFITKLNEMTGKSFRLPTEAEWEYAARGGKKSNGYKYAGSDDINEVAWCYTNGNNKTHTVATKTPNELGLYDMSGNVNEWCYDWFGNYYATDSSVNPQGPDSGSNKVHRGGSYAYNRQCRVTYRGYCSPTNVQRNIGFRLAMSSPD